MLRQSENAAYDHMKAAKVARRYPIVLGLLSAGRLSLTTIRLLAPHLTHETHAELFAAAEGKSKRDVQKMLAQRFPVAPVPFSVRKLPTPPAATVAEVAPVAPRHPSVATVATPAPQVSAPFVSIPTPPRPVSLPLAEDRFRITFTADTATCNTLELARDLLRHAIPDGDAAQIFRRALDVLVEDLVRQKFAGTDRPSLSRGQAGDSRNIPAAVKREVYIRDRGRCAYVAPNGRRCGERAFLEFHHIHPYAAGGLPTVDNVSLRCRSHNQYEAAVFFGTGAGLAREAAAVYGCVKAHTFSGRPENVSTLPRSTQRL